MLLLALGVPGAFAQGTGGGQDEMNSTPIQAGYVIVTPTSGEPGALVVFETFGERRGKDIPQAGVLPSSISTRFLLFVSKSGRLSRNLGVAIANPNKSKDAHLELTLRDDLGLKAADMLPITVGAGKQVAWMVTELFPDQPSVPQDFVGTLDIFSTDEPVAVIGLRFRGMNFSTLPATRIGPAEPWPSDPVAGGPGSVILPHFVTGGGWATEIVLVNSNTDPLADPLKVRVDLFTQSGDPLTAQLNGITASSFSDIEIPSGGVKVLSKRDLNGDSEP